MPAPLLCVVHIPKTGGSSLRVTLNDMLGHQRVYWMVLANAEHWKDPKNLDFSRFAAVGGHHSVAVFDMIERPKVFMAVVRDPIERAISLFHYIVEGSPRQHPLRSELQGLSLLQALERSRQFRNQVTNVQCLMIGGARHFAAARRSLCERVWFVDSSERAAALFARVCKEFGWPGQRLKRKNVGRSGYAEAYISEEAIGALGEINRHDMQLYHMFAGELPEPVKGQSTFKNDTRGRRGGGVLNVRQSGRELRCDPS